MSHERAAPRVREFADQGALLRAAAAQVLCRGREAVRERGRFDLALAGGSTPLGLYEALGGARSARSRVWRHARLFWGDERVVPPDDPASNYGAAWKAGLHRLAVPPAEVHRVPGESGDARRAAVIYETALRSCFGGAAWPRLDLVLLGLGTDGHVASLFPGSPALAERERWVAVAEGGTPAVPRLTLTLPVLNSARCILVLVTGEAKASVLARVRQPAGADPLPAQRLRPAAGGVIIFADRAAVRVE